jgi:peptide/nickel transport system permease protein
MEEKDLQQENLQEENVQTSVENVAESAETPLDKNVRLMSPTRMLLRRFFRSKLSIVGLIMLVSLFAFCWLGPTVYQRWGEI